MGKIVILGGGFGGIYAARALEKLLDPAQHELILVNKDNYFIYYPMLSEVVGGSLGLFDTISPIRALLKKTHLYVREVEKIDIQRKEVILTPQFSHQPTILPYDHLVLALGNVTDFRDNPGLHEHALPFKSLADALLIRNRVIDVIDAASIETDLEVRKQLLTFVVGGGGFSGTEVCAEVNDLARRLAKKYSYFDPDEIQVILIHSQEHLLGSEMPEPLSIYAQKLLMKRGVKIHFGVHLKTATPGKAILSDGTSILCKTIISSVPSSPNPIINDLPLLKIKGRLKTNPYMQVEGSETIWALGDCALIPLNETFTPPTGQFATREAKQLANNLAAHLQGRPKQPFYFKSLGALSALGHHAAVAQLFDRFNFSGFFAWLLWRLVYWGKIPGLARKVKILVSWFFDLIIPSEPIHLKISPQSGIIQIHFETGEIIFNEGDVGDYFYIITDGEVEVLTKKNGLLGHLKQGEYFGETALLHQRVRFATVKCTKPTNVLALHKRDFGMLVANLEQLKQNFENTEKERAKRL